MTYICLTIYRYFKTHRPIFWTLLISLFVFFGYFSMQIHLEEDLNKLMPSSKNEDGSTKLAFESLKIKDKMFILFEGKNGAPIDSITSVCDMFIGELTANDSNHAMIENVFYLLPEDIMFDAVDYVTEHLPAFIDTTIYNNVDTLLTAEHMLRQMQQNSKDLDSDFGTMFPELIEMDPLGIRSLLKDKYGNMMSGSTGGYKTVEGHIFVPDSTVCLAFITPAYSSTNTGQGSALFKILNSQIDKYDRLHPDVKVCYHGRPASGYYNSSTIKGDLVSTIGISFIIVLVFLFFCFRNKLSLPLLALAVAFGALFGLSSMYFIRGHFSLMALGIGAIVLGVAMSYVLHILTHHQFVGDPEKVLKDEVKPVCLGCLTTIGSFSGLLFVESELLKDFGLFAALSIVGTTVFSLIFLPQLLPVKNEESKNPKLFGMVERCNHYQLDRSKPLIGVMSMIIIVCVGAFFCGGSLFDADMRNIGYSAERTSYSENLLRAKTFTADKSTYLASSGTTAEEALMNFQSLEESLDSLQQLGLVKSYTHTTQLLIPSKVQQERIDAWNGYWTPERKSKARQLVAQTAASADLVAEGFDYFFELLDADYQPDALYEADIIPEGYLSTMMEKSYNNEYLCFTSMRCEYDSVRSDSSAYIKICDAIASQPNLLVLDTVYYTKDELEKLNSDFNILQWISMLFVLVVLFFSFHFNIKHTLLGFAPILLSWLIVLGSMVLFGYKFNLINIVISTFIFGIGVDYSIFMMTGLIGGADERDEKLLHYHKTAITLSAVILFITVASMLFAKHPAIQSVGFSTFIGLVSAVLISYVMQPAVYRLLQSGKTRI